LRHSLPFPPTHPPTHHNLKANWRGYSAASGVSERKWFVNGASVYDDSGTQVKKDFTIDSKQLGELGKGSVIRVAVDQEGVMWMAFSESGDRVQVCNGIPFDEDIYAFADIYGKAVAITLFDLEQSTPTPSASSSKVRTIMCLPCFMRQHFVCAIAQFSSARACRF